MVEELVEADPTRIGPYDLLGILGSGGMGRVYLGQNADGGRVAVKVVHADLACEPEFRRRFRREIDAPRAVSGPGIAAILDADAEAKRPWPATEYVDGNLPRPRGGLGNAQCQRLRTHRSHRHRPLEPLTPQAAEAGASV